MPRTPSNGMQSDSPKTPRSALDFIKARALWYSRCQPEIVPRAPIGCNELLSSHSAPAYPGYDYPSHQMTQISPTVSGSNGKRWRLFSIKSAKGKADTNEASRKLLKTKSSPNLKVSTKGFNKTPDRYCLSASLPHRSQFQAMPKTPRTPHTAVARFEANEKVPNLVSSIIPPTVPQTPSMLNTVTTSAVTKELIPDLVPPTIYFTVDPCWDLSKGNTAELFFIPSPDASVAIRAFHHTSVRS